MTFIPQKLDANIDARYYFKMYEEKSRVENGEKAVSDPNELITVTAKVTDFEAWKKLPNVMTRAQIRSGETWIITGSVPKSEFEAISNLPFVKHLSMATEVRPFNQN